jgi:predicted DNA-binding protein with PD1-like motif
MSTPPSSRIANAAIVSLIGAADSFAISTMPAHGATTDTIAAYNQPTEMTGTGEIADRTVYVHAVMAIDGDRGIAGHLQAARIGTHFARAYLLIYNGPTARHADHRLHVTKSAAPAWLPANESAWEMIFGWATDGQQDVRRQAPPTNAANARSPVIIGPPAFATACQRCLERFHTAGVTGSIPVSPTTTGLGRFYVCQAVAVALSAR